MKLMKLRALECSEDSVLIMNVLTLLVRGGGRCKTGVARAEYVSTVVEVSCVDTYQFCQVFRFRGGVISMPTLEPDMCKAEIFIHGHARSFTP
jgi:hypothetical protein